VGRGTTKEGVVGGLFDGGEDGGEICDEGIDGLVLAGWVIAIIDGKVGLAVLTGVPPDPPFLLPFCLPTARVGGCDIFFEVTFPPFPHRRLLPRNF
jgi:hypothetical protein